ncbi:MAG: hypothetical protein CL526_06630 [Aequorivita sp.]|nr:hypothetical protein [Aequorivita sp.]|tara:strand:+ start:184821 stop:185306 length:486 start_codon:yes stop_codon:yes gene_type:complete
MISRFLLATFTVLMISTSCKDNSKETTEPTVPAETRATIEYSENQLDTIKKENNTESAMTFKATGNEPFWSVNFKDGKVHFKAMDAALKSFTAPIPEAEVTGNTQKFVAQSHRVIMEVYITEEACQDSMSGQNYTHKVKVSIKPKSADNFNHYHGCGSYIE